MSDPGLPEPDRPSGAQPDIIVREALSSPDPHVRAYSVYLLGLDADSRRKELFIASIRDNDKRVRAQASRALAALGETALPDLIRLLGDDDWRIRYRAAEGLGHIHSPGSVEPLIRALLDEKDHVRYMAAKSLGALAEEAAVPGIISRLRDENEYVRRMAVIALGKIGDSGGIAAILAMLEREGAASVRDAIRNVLNERCLMPGDQTGPGRA